MCLCKTSIFGAGIFDPRAIICPILVKTYQMQLHTKYQKPAF